MNTYYECLKHFKTLLEEDSKVNTITSASRREIDFDNANIFPLVNVYIEDSPFISKANGAVTRYNVEITVLNRRDNNKEATKDKFWYNDNRHDNWNLTRAILKVLHNKLIKKDNDVQIDLVSATSAIKIDNEFVEQELPFTQVFNMYNPDIEIEQ